MAFQAQLLLILCLSTLPSTFAQDNVIELDLGAKATNQVDGDIVDLYDPVLRLNRHSFNENILKESTDEVTHWIVLFCPAWYEPCQALEPLYRQLTVKWQYQLNIALLSREVGFAAVDCATEKALCNTQNVGMNYPFVAHYRQRKQVGVWRGKSFEKDAQRLMSFLQKRLGGTAVASSGKPESDDVTAEGSQDFPVDFLLIFAAIAGNAWLISRSSCGSDTKKSSGASVKQAAPPVLVSPPDAQSQHHGSCVQRSPVDL